MKKLIITLVFMFCAFVINAQITFITSAKITFEKKLNLKRQMASNTWLSDDAKDKMAQYVTTKWEYSFNDASSIYKAEKKDTKMNDNSFIFSSGEQTAELYSDLAKNARIIKKPILGEDYILKDTIPRIDWKIVNDVRKIAGFECRKAIGVINDSVYVVAFYTDEILLKGGPEGFTGLPGMILGLAIPRYNTTWFATKIDAVNVPTLTITAPSKGKKAESEKDIEKLVELFTRYSDKKNQPKTEAIKKMIYGFTL